MADRDLTIRFVGKDAGLGEAARTGSAAIGALGDAAEKANVELGEKTRITIERLTASMGLNEKQVALLTDRLVSLGEANFELDANGKLRTATGQFIKVKDVVDEAAEATDRLENSASGAVGKVGALDKVFTGFLEGIGRQGLDLAIAGVQQLGQAIQATVSEALDQSAAFDEARASAATLTNDTDGLITALQGAQGRLGNQVTTTELLAASYDILSSGFTEASDAAAIAEAAARGALAGFSDTDTAADALTTIINSYGQMGITAADSEQIIDKLVKTQDLGKITLGEYSAQIGRAASIAATAGVTFDEFSAAIATATSKGVQPESAISGTRQAIVNLLKPTSEATGLLKQFGINNASAALRSGGLIGVLQTLKDQGATTEQLSKIFSDVDALATVATLAGENLGTFKTNLEGISGASGTTDKNLKILTETINGQKKALEVIRQEGFLKLGQAIEPIRAGLLTFANGLISATVEGSAGLGELSAAGERLRVVLSGNPEIAEKLGAALANVADAGVEQIALLIDAITAFVAEEDNVDAIAANFETLAEAVTKAGQAARFIVALADGMIQFKETVDGVPVLGAVFNFSPANPIANVQRLSESFGSLKNIITNTAEFAANLVGRFDVLANNPVISALLGQILKTETAVSNVGKSLASGLTAGSKGLDTALTSIKKETAKAVSKPPEVPAPTPPDLSAIEVRYEGLTTKLETEEAKQIAALVKGGADREKIAAKEQEFLQKRIALNQQKADELKAIDASTLNVADREKLNKELLSLEKSLNTDRIKIAEAAAAAREAAEKKALDAIEEAADKAVNVATEGEQKRQIELAKLRRDGVIGEEEYQEQLTNAGRDRIRAELEAEQKKYDALKNAAGADEDDKTESRQRVNALTLELIESEIEAEEEASAVIKESVESRAAAAENAFKAEVLSAEQVATALEAINGAYDRQAQLLSARTNLLNTLGSALSDSFNNGVTLLNQDIASAKKEKDRTRLTKERDNLEKQAAAARRASLERSQQLELLTFDLRQKQLQIENQIEQARIRGAIAENQAAQARAQANIATLQAEGASAEQVQAAQLDLQASRQSGEALAQQFTATLEQAGLIQELAGAERSALIASQGSALQNADVAELDRRFQALDARAETARGGRERRAIEQEREGLQAQNNRLQRETRQEIQFLGQSEAATFSQAIAGLDQFATRIEGTGLVGNASNAALNPLQGAIAPPITPATPLPVTLPPEFAAMVQQMTAGAGTVGNITNDVTINITGADTADGGLAQNVEDQVFAGLSRVISRTQTLLG